jgi:hypothetical protein
LLCYFYFKIFFITFLDILPGLKPKVSNQFLKAPENSCIVFIFFDFDATTVAAPWAFARLATSEGIFLSGVLGLFSASLSSAN